MKYVHGEYLVTRAGDIVLTQAYGPWNRECVEAFGMDYRAETICLHGSRWSDIVVLQGESLLIPDAQSLLHAMIEAVHNLGLAHVALVLGHSSVQSSTRMQLDLMYRDAGPTYRFFDQYGEALAWLTSYGYRLDSHLEQQHFGRVG